MKIDIFEYILLGAAVAGGVGLLLMGTAAWLPVLYGFGWIP